MDVKQTPANTSPAAIPPDIEGLLAAMLDGKTTHPNEVVTYLVDSARQLREKGAMLDAQMQQLQSVIARTEKEMAEAHGAYVQAVRDAAHWIARARCPTLAVVPTPPEAAKAEPGPTTE